MFIPEFLLNVESMVKFFLLLSTLFVNEILEISELGAINSLSLLADNPLPTATSAHINSKAESNENNHSEFLTPIGCIS